jgi:predicted transcriptional regulator
MQLPKDLLSEKNYEGTRLIEINDENILKLFKERSEILKSGEPIMKRMDELSKPLDEFYARLKPLEEERKQIKEDMQPAIDAYQAVVDEMDRDIYQKTRLIDQKLNPMVDAVVKDQLSEFEKAKTLTERDGKYYVEVEDQLEEKIKLIRATKK